MTFLLGNNIENERLLDRKVPHDWSQIVPTRPRSQRHTSKESF